jgi:hypothetical protein
MLSQPATKIFLHASEPRAAKWISDTIGEVEEVKMERTKATVRMTILTQHKMRGRQRLRRKHALIGNWQSSFTLKRIDDDGF